MPIFPRIRHRLIEGDVDRLEAGFGEDGGGFIGGAACFDDDPGEIVRDEHEGVHEAGEVEGLECTDVGGSDDDERPRALDPVLRPLLLLDPLDQAVGPHHLGGIRVGPRPDADPVAADDDAAGRPVEEERRRRWSGLEREDQVFGGAPEHGGGGIVGGGGEEEEEDEAREAEAEDKAYEAAEAMED